MARPELPPVGVSMSADVEVLDGRPKPYRARVRWIDPATGRRKSKSECVATLEAAQAWIDGLSRAARGGIDPKGTKGKRARTVPLIEEIRPMVAARLLAAKRPDDRLFFGPKGGRISTAVLRDATHWDDVAREFGHEQLVRHDLRHTGLTWMADAGVPVHVLRKIAGHGSLSTTQRCLHPDRRSFEEAAEALSAHLTARRSTNGPRLRAV
jgi:integrase